MSETVLIMEPTALAEVREAMRAIRAGADPASVATPRVSAPLASVRGSNDASAAERSLRERGYYVVNGVGVLPIVGEIWRSADSFWARVFGGTTVGAISSAAEGLLADTSVKRVMLHVDSPGGTVHVHAAVEAIRRLAAAKPLHAGVDGYACSGGFWPCCLADEIAVTPVGFVGSVGAVFGAVIFDVTEMLEQDGIRAHGISTDAKHKLLGYWGLPVDEEQLAAKKAQLEQCVRPFIADVVQGRGLSESVVRGRQGIVLVGQDAVDGVYADRIVTTIDEYLSELAGMAPGVRAVRPQRSFEDEDKEPAPAEPENQESTMATNPPAGSGAAPVKADENNAPPSASAPKAEPQNGPATFAQLKGVAEKLPEARRSAFIVECQEKGLTVDAAKDHLVECALKIASDSAASSQSELERLRAENADLKKLGDEGKGVAAVNGGKVGGGGGVGDGVEDKLGIAKCASYNDAIKHVRDTLGCSLDEAVTKLNADPVGKRLRKEHVAAVNGLEFQP